MSKSLVSKNVIITGASSGIGRACAIECSNSGARVHLVARNLEKLREVFIELGENAHTINSLDVTSSEEIEPLVREIVDTHGKIDGFIHSAGVQYILPVRAMNKQRYIDVLSLNTIAAFEFSRVLSKKSYCASSGLSLVFISSVMSVAANAGLTSYCASKAALVGGARAMAIELASKNIRVNCVSPGTVSDTRMTEGLQDSISDDEFERIVSEYPMGLGDTKDVATMCVFLLSDDAKWITGQNIVIDGGYSAR
ncbi:MAG: SDR family NAD(P)-dependent oxidoreductase [Bacteroidales bacterium]|nr:SDR family NAD(P)-dependent oxidoreductase [Bacteroidales bacterium]